MEEQFDLDSVLKSSTKTSEPMPTEAVVPVMTEVVRAAPSAIVRRHGIPTPTDLLADFDRTMTMCQVFAAAMLAGGKDINQAKAQVFLAVMRGAEMGMPPASSISEIFVLPGKGGAPKFVVSSRAMAGVLAAHGILVDPPVEEKRGQTCSVTVHREGKSYTSLWTITRAKEAGLADKDNWRAFPMEMLRARATAEACRMAAPDLLCGVFVREEVDDRPKSDTASVIDALEGQQ